MNKKIVLKLSLMGLLLFSFASSTAYANEKSETVAKAKAENGHVKGKRPPRAAHIFITVARFENKCNAPDRIFERIRACIQQCIVGTMKFEVAERECLKAVLKESMLVDSGIMDDVDSNSVKNAKKQSASYVIYGTVLSTDNTTESVCGYGMAYAVVRSKIKLVVKLANVETGRIVAVKTVVGHGMDRVIASGESKSSAGQGSREAIDEAGHAVADWLREVLACPAKVLKVDKSEITIDMNENEVKEGDVFDVIEEGDVIIDPDGGAVLGYDSKDIGRVVITSTGSKISKAKPVDGGKLSLDKLDVRKHTYRLRRVSKEALKKRFREKRQNQL